MRASAEQDISVGGPNLAAQAIRAGLVDELQLFLTPVVVGGGQHWLPDGAQLSLELVDERRFASGVVFLRYRPRRDYAGAPVSSRLARSSRTFSRYACSLPPSR